MELAFAIVVSLGILGGVAVIAGVVAEDRNHTRAGDLLVTTGWVLLVSAAVACPVGLLVVAWTEALT